MSIELVGWGFVLAAFLTGCSTSKTEKLVDKFCACKSEGCVIALMGESNAEAMKTLMNDESANVLALRQRMQTCIVNIPGALGREVALKMNKKSSTSEATDNLKSLEKAVLEHYSNNSRTFPDSNQLTPPLGACCQTGGQCSPTASWWETPTWKALGFSLSDEHRYSYKFETSMDNEGAKQFTLTAQGDLDCDGVYSEFTLFGMEVDGELVTAGDVLKVNALE